MDWCDLAEARLLAPSPTARGSAEGTLKLEAHSGTQEVDDGGARDRDECDLRASVGELARSSRVFRDVFRHRKLQGWRFAWEPNIW